MESSLCGQGHLWDSELFWGPEGPRLSPCCIHVLLPLVTALLILILAPFEVRVWKISRSPRLGFSRLGLGKVGTAVALLATLVVRPCLPGNSLPPLGLWVGVGVEALSLLLYTLALFISLRRGVASSAPQWLFSLALCTTATIPLLLTSHTKESWHHTDSLAITRVLLTVFLLLLNSFAEKRGKSGFEECPEENVSFLQRLFYLWSLPLLWQGFRAPLTAGHLWPLPKQLTSDTVIPNFESKLEQVKKVPQQEKSEQNAQKPFSVFPALARSLRGEVMFVGCLELVTLVCWQASPLVMRRMITLVRDAEEETNWHSFFYTALLFLLQTIAMVVLSQNHKNQFTIGMQLRTSLTSALYKKSLRLTPEARQESTVGEVVNLMSADVGHVVMLGQHINFLWSCPMQVGVATVAMYQILGWPALVGMASLLLATPFVLVLAKLISALMGRQMKIKDQRLQILNEIIGGMKVLKVFAWEPAFMDRVLEKREEETAVLKTKGALHSCFSFLWNLVPFMVGFVAFACHSLTGEELTAEQAFVTLAYLNIMRFPMMMMGVLVPWVMMTRVSLLRINKFLNHKELEDASKVATEQSKDVLSITNGTFKWGEEEGPVLKNLNITAVEGGLTAVVGRVGSGKSSLLASFLGELHQCGGKVERQGTTAYLPQQPWIQNYSLRQNILFCQEEKEARYQAVLEACALGPDLKVLPAGDLTELGERGISLSGGQKQRVSLARAVYSQADVYLLDDPLAAVDAHVGHHLFQQVIGPEGLLATKTRVLVTHGLTYLPQCDHIIVLADGEVQEQGSYSKLVEQGGEFAKFLEEHRTAKSVAQDQKRPSRHGLVLGLEGNQKEMEQETEEKQPLLTKTMENDQMEVAATGRVSSSVYLTYLSALGPGGCLITLVTLTLAMVAMAATNWWVKVWTDTPTNTTSSSKQTSSMTNLSVYGGLGLVQSTMFLLYSLALVYTTLRGSKLLHKNMLARLMRSPMSFFERTPLGRIVNRFGKDIDACDAILPQTIKMLLLNILKLLTLTIMIVAIMPVMLVVVLPVASCFLVLQQCVVRSLRQLQRLDSISRSPIYSHFSESVTGAASIRAYGRTEEFTRRAEWLVDQSQRCYYPSMVADQLLLIALTTLANLVTLGVAVLLPSMAISPGSTGLVLTCCLQLPPMMADLMRFSAQLETNIVAVERIREYSKLEQEAAWESVTAPDTSWPAAGRVEMEEVTLRYKEGGEPALLEVSCCLEAGQRVGVVGRTGAGKSSLATALFRLVEADSGTIRIDGVDISTMGLHNLRSKLTIIPQDPILFAGTLRINVDPFSRHSDASIWAALQQAHLATWASGLEDGLQYRITEGGDNLSVGQRQLVCLVRALLRRSKVLLLDEATAAMDMETDSLIQATIREEFTDSTVITIAHRIHTIIDYDLIMVMEGGRVVESGKPSKLMEDSSSYFYSLVKASDSTTH